MRSNDHSPPSPTLRGFLQKLVGMKSLQGADSRVEALERQIEALQRRIAELESASSARLNGLEQRFQTYYRERFNCIDKVADYLVGAELPGDYYEFGVFKGVTFAYAMTMLQRLFRDMQFVALDSFEGLPVPRGLDVLDGYSSGFQAGEFACDESSFLSHVKASGGDMSRLTCVKGWFDQTLPPLSASLPPSKRVAAAWIDCDLYESTVPVLNFLTSRLDVGSVILFDDWRCFRNLPDRGEQRACAEWLAANPQIRLREFVDFGFHGVSFTVERC